jgi:hypothetical protein
VLIQCKKLMYDLQQHEQSIWFQFWQPLDPFDSNNPTCCTSSHKLFLASVIGWLYGCHLLYRRKVWVYALLWLRSMPKDGDVLSTDALT